MRLFTSLLCLLVLFSCQSPDTGKEKTSLSNLNWIGFTWKGDSLGKKYFDRAAIFIPLHLQNISQNFAAQFDMGANASLIYGNVFKPYLQLYPEYAKKLDTINAEISIGDEKQGELKDVTVQMDSFKYHYDILPFFKNYGENLSADSAKTATPKHIGTLGADMLQNKVLVIDYPNKRLAILDSLPAAQFALFDFEPCKIDNNRIKLPLLVNKQKQWYMFDTGASIFSIVTSPDNWKNICETGKTDTLAIQSWGRSYNMYGAATRTDIFLNKTKLPKTTAYKVELPEYLEMFTQEKIAGIVGNSYFLNSTIAIDFRKSQFGILR